MIHEYSVQELRLARDAANRHIPVKGATGRIGVSYTVERDVILDLLDQEIKYATERDLRRGKPA